MDAKQPPMPVNGTAVGIAEIYGATISVSFSSSEAPEVQRAIIARLRAALKQLPAESSPRASDELFWSWAQK